MSKAIERFGIGAALAGENQRILVKNVETFSHVDLFKTADR